MKQSNRELEGSYLPTVTKTESKGFKEEIELPEKTSCSIEGKLVRIKGENGQVERKFPDPIARITLEEGKIVLTTEKHSKKEKKMLGSIKSHIKNMIKGVNSGHAYILKICSGHFPMNVSATGKEFIVKNFLGERVPRKMEIKGEIKIKVAGNDIYVEGINKEQVSQCAASIEQLTRRANFDRRIFQDGIYLISKDGKNVR